ncbi:peptidyl-tRNA hydrolase 2, mitochondrial-like isoform X3 [Salvia splendens]|uniref:peptidyl-tRNA hydrolase 2, mitochondrial-like isoform X3 n=1 Tax=Salvia splendens TaxID=180675 RepID=UPI001C27390D|nr:peptidyl-tRNA hydrolase 2, mitochondrial-like isoform X3 [Salvia splendens]
MSSYRNPLAIKKHEKMEVLGVSFRPENFIPGLIIGFICGFFLDLAKPAKGPSGRKIGSSPISKNHQQPRIASSNNEEELKMVLVVRQDLKMGSGKIASQCAHAATGMYADLVQRNKIKDAAETIGLPTFTVADAGRTQVSAGSKTVLAVGPGNKSAVDSVTGKLRLL